ncbi:MAG: gamma-glutamyltransferase [Minwuia sp.]|uniref:gamma-glutamyltransferase n=1 Tax=Minwuia sp. TaxID=2493630 RepID=UPI003A87FEF4
MRDLQQPGRSVVHATNGAAATSHPFSTLAAMEILQAGGNAVDAAVAACAVQCVVEPMSTGIGGDCFVLLQKGGQGPVIGLNGSGHAPAKLTADHLLDQGIDSIGLESPHSVTVPGAVDAWCRLLDDHGTMGIDRVLQRAIAYAESGFAVTPRISVDWSRNVKRLSLDASSAAQYLRDGVSPSAGEVWRSPELAGTLKAIASKGRAGFYEGAVAEDIVAHLQSHGAVHELDDLAAQACDYVDPISSEYAGRQIMEIPPNGQGVTALLMLNILKGFDLEAYDPVSVERLHIEAEATRLAFAERDKYVADPRQSNVPVEHLLSEELAAELREKISLGKAMADPAKVTGPVYRDTVYLTVVDRDLNAVSFINSLYFSFGSCLTAPKSGVLLQNRGAGFVVDKEHPNCVAPRKRPLHTIIPGMVLGGDGRCEISFGVMGGGYQPVGHAHLLTNIFDYGMDVQEAIDCPRTFHVAGKLDVERSVPDNVRQGLAALGHETQTPEMPWGGAQAIMIDYRNGTMAAGSDPRKDGCAMGF